MNIRYLSFFLPLYALMLSNHGDCHMRLCLHKSLLPTSIPNEVCDDPSNVDDANNAA